MVQPKKHLGQHFLLDHNIARKIVNSISDETIPWLEIGPGKGVLTRYLMEKKLPEFKVIEIDYEAVEYLHLEFPSLKENILSADFLEIDPQKLFPVNYGIIGNFPYNISSQIFFKVLEERKLVNEVVCMIQREVAERLVSGPKTKVYGILSVLLQAFYDIEMLFPVGEKVFFPPPKVKSAVIRLKRNQTSKLDCDEVLFFKVVKAGFNQRRKTLRNALSGILPPGHQVPADILSKRAEQLTVADFVGITAFIQ
ncbi:MAG: 16S rRNA (adenine(1518)-N(6)/adenine(1519)-N(6))-dimethyltransferase RsmA [Bacteroidota bacterium]